MGALYQGDNPGAMVVIDAIESRGSQLGLQIVRLPSLIRRTTQVLSRVRNVIGSEHCLLWMMERSRNSESLSWTSRLSTRCPSWESARILPGALITYGPRLDVVYRRAAYYVDKILSGERAAFPSSSRTSSIFSSI
jgi:hypothetical protein